MSRRQMRGDAAVAVGGDDVGERSRDGRIGGRSWMMCTIVCEPRRYRLSSLSGGNDPRGRHTSCVAINGREDSILYLDVEDTPRYECRKTVPCRARCFGRFVG